VTPGTPHTRTFAVAVFATIVLGLGVFGALIAVIEQRKDGNPAPWIVISALLGPLLAIVVMLWVRARDD